ncbi:MAG: hypothetical protein SX243_25865 [Acidobacteriota bacterium]|nr:hypothetical protein [Acidobacteriota bacterium]
MSKEVKATGRQRERPDLTKLATALMLLLQETKQDDDQGESPQEPAA